MRGESTLLSGPLGRDRVVFVHSAGRRRFLGRSGGANAHEVTLEEVEALAAAGFDIVEVNRRDGAPLCAELVSPQDRRPRGVAPRRPARVVA